MVRAFIAAVLQVAAAFGVGLTQEQVGAIDALILAAIPVATLLFAFLARQKVMPTEPGESQPQMVDSEDHPPMLWSD